VLGASLYWASNFDPYYGASADDVSIFNALVSKYSDYEDGEQLFYLYEGLISAGYDSADLNFGDSIFNTYVDSTFILKEGRISVDLGWVSDAILDRSTPTIRMVLPSSTREFLIVDDYRDNKGPKALNELYCYAAEPPIWKKVGDGNPMLPLEYVKTIYVPADSVKTYEDAWFNYTGAEFKPIPANYATIDKWY
jgi:hypothetical protein